MPARTNRINETRTALNGQSMKIIAYRNACDIDIEFEDGIIVYNKLYSNFKKGVIKNPQFYSSKIGETNISNEGFKMTIIRYENHKNIDIQFEDGVTVHQKRYDSFQKGAIKHPNVKQKTFNDRTGETTVNAQGLKMSIIKYRSARDIDVQFEDGTIIEHRTYRNFKAHSIKKPGQYTNKNKIGESIIANNGMRMTIIAYRGIKDIDVQFEDGTIVYNKAYGNFKNKEIDKPKEDKTGEISIANNGMKMKIIKYQSSKDIDIQFEDGYVAKHKNYNDFTHGAIGHKWPYTAGHIVIERIAYRYLTETNYEYICHTCHHHDIGTLSEIKQHECKGV